MQLIRQFMIEASITREIDQSLDFAIGAEWDAADLQSSTYTVVHAILMHHTTDAGQFYAIAEGLALHKPRFADLKSQGYNAVFEKVAAIVKLQRSDLAIETRGELAAVLVALIDGASLQVQFGKLAATENAIAKLSNSIARAMVQLVQHWD